MTFFSKSTQSQTSPRSSDALSPVKSAVMMSGRHGEVAVHSSLVLTSMARISSFVGIGPFFSCREAVFTRVPVAAFCTTRPRRCASESRLLRLDQHLVRQGPRARLHELVAEDFDGRPCQLGELRAAADKRQDMQVEVLPVISQRAGFQLVEPAALQPEFARLRERRRLPNLEHAFRRRSRP